MTSITNIQTNTHCILHNVISIQTHKISIFTLFSLCMSIGFGIIYLYIHTHTVCIRMFFIIRKRKKFEFFFPIRLLVVVYIILLPASINKKKLFFGYRNSHMALVTIADREYIYDYYYDYHHVFHVWM